MADSSESSAILAELKAEFAALHKRIDKLESTSTQTQRTVNRGFKSVTDSLAWSDFIQNLILYGVCLAAVTVTVSIDKIKSDVCPSAPSWLVHLVPFGDVICSGAISLSTNTNAVDRPEIMAFLDTIAWAEGTGESYTTQYTFAQFSGFTDHPRQILCSGSLCSDAAGRYQFLSTTWDSQAKALGLNDFSPHAQDLGAIQLLKANGAYDKILSGDIEGAVNAVRSIWASFPGAGHNQPEKSMSEVLRVYQEKLAARKSQSVSPTKTIGKAFPLPGLTYQTASVTSPYGDRIHPTKGIHKMHYGVDFGAAEGTPVLATEAGVIKQVNPNDGGCGQSVAVDFQDGRGMRVCHLSAIDVQPGQQVSAGQAIGKVGNTGDSSGPHLHFEFTQNGAAVDPTEYLQSLGSSGQSYRLEQTKPSIAPIPPASFVSIQTSDGLCSGFAVAPDKIATAKHCIENSAAVTVVPQSGDWLKGQMVASAEDAVIVQVQGANFTPAQLGTVPAEGATLQTWGHPEGASAIEPAQLKVTTIDGSIINAAPVSGKVVGGFSGGQVVDSDGAIVGFNSEANPEGRVKIQSIDVVKGLLK